jgi:CPA1 family monovalent cation:H+ antiporter
MGNLLPFLMFGIFAAAMLARLLSRQYLLSLPVALVVLGFVSSEAWVLLGKDTGLRWQIMRDLVFYLLLPILIFESAINISLKAIRRDGVLILAMAVPLLLAAALIGGAVVHLAIGYQLGGMFALALLIGTMISATDPTSVPGMAGSPIAPGRLTMLLSGESLVNDAASITLFVFLTALILEPNAEFTLAYLSVQFFLILLGGAATGSLLGWLFDRIIRPLNDVVLTTASTLVLAFASFWLNEHLLGWSGVVATLAAGVTFAFRQNTHRSEEDVAFALQSWRIFGFCADAILFFLVGMSITVGMFQDHWLAMLVGILAAMVSRIAIVYLGLGPLSRLPWFKRLKRSDLNIVFWGGTRGAIAVALALSLSTDIPHWYTIQSTVYGVALFGLAVQTPLVRLLMKNRFAAGRP